jgi:triacylglycerol esterase/lipase EstA (alpha/beta hydrolase family)
MTAFSMFVLLVAGGAGYVSWAKHAVAQGAPLWWYIVGAPVAYLAPVTVLVAIWFLLSWIWRTPRPPSARLGVAASVRMFVDEVLTVAASWPLMVLHRPLMRDPAPAPNVRPIILVHGVLVNDGVWFGFRRHLERQGIAGVYTLNYGPPQADIERFAEQLAAKIDAVCAATGASRVVLICHSMGGLVARTYLRRLGGGRVERIITIGTPHHGSDLAWSFPGRCLAQMRPGNAWLTELNRAEGDAPVPITSIWSRHDSMVVPQASCELAGAQNLAIVGVGHNALLSDTASLNLAVCVLKQ